MELWDAYNENEELLDLNLKRGEKIKEGCYHLVCEVLVEHIGGSYLLMKRAYSKEAYPDNMKLRQVGSIKG